MQSLLRTPLDLPGQAAVAAAAAAAPSVFNTQPWSFSVSPAGLDVYADPGRASLPTASAERDVHLSCGAAVLNARAALARLGHGTRVSVLPDAGDPLLVARITVTDEAPDQVLGRLYGWVHLRRTNRYPFAPEPLASEVVALLRDAASREGASLRLLDREPEYQRVLSLIRAATGKEEEAVREDRAARLSPGSAPSVIPVGSLGPVPRRGGYDDPAVRDMAEGIGLPGRTCADFEPRPDLAVLETPGDDPASWVAAGQSLQRLLLTAAEHAVAASFANQPLEDADLRDAVSASAAHYGHPQMVLRIGYPLTQPPASPRRPLSEALRRDGD
ncbi:Acg family FMN-binding oxidoreductase [Streptomyces sp. NPDC102441]|uniref:Acg family FMN-binding oxidoreductase n=1 Tax=Streptomyces sp. NPDC102441 TaxID=3366176 RepID=UPI0038240433